MSENKILINKNNKIDLLSQREEIPVPKDIFTTTKTVNKKNKSKTTTARLSFETSYRANALITMGISDSFDSLFSDMLDELESKLSRDERLMQKSIIEMYRNKNK